MAQDSIDAAPREAEDTRMKQLIRRHEQFSRFFTTQDTSMPPIAAGEVDAIVGGNESRAVGRNRKNGMPPDSPRRPGLFPIALDRVLELGNLVLSRQRMSTHHAACYGDFIARSAVEPRKLPVTAYVTDVITPAFGRRLEAIVHSMEAIDDGHWFHPAYLRNALRRNDHERNGGGGSRENFKTTRPGREAVAPRATFAKDVTKGSAASPAAVYGTFRHVRRFTKTPTYFIAEATAPWSELMRRGIIDALCGTDDWGAKVLDLLTTSLTAITYSNYEGKIRLCAELCIDEESISPRLGLTPPSLPASAASHGLWSAATSAPVGVLLVVGMA
eukprot:jgi/Tetstr1/422754/TSEL_013551.t1